MTMIRDLLTRDLGQKIEEIIKLDQADEQSVHTEITEYIATERIREQYRDILRAIAEAPSQPNEGVGVWISGFFGSGKSSFAKNLGYALSNRAVLGKPAGTLFKQQIGDDLVTSLVDNINGRIPTEVIMFDVSVDRAVRNATEKLAEVMYTVLLRELDYATDYDIAELEIELEAGGKLDAFVALCQKEYGDWRTVRKGAQKVARASAILHKLEAKTYPAADSWARSLKRSEDISVAKLVERSFDLAARRRSGKALFFIIDEVGQYVARSTDKILDLQAIVREFGLVGKNRVKAKKAIAPIWVAVTSQEKLDEVVAALDSRRVELAKLQDSFKYRIDMAPADIREVATRRVLAKKPAAETTLAKLFAANEGSMRTACRLQRTHRKSDLNDKDFVQFYPYLPHFVELSIDIMSGIRLQPGAPRHLGGSNRTIIKQVYEMLVSERTALAGQKVGTLVTLDRIFELVEGNLNDEKRKDIDAITTRLDDKVKKYFWPSRVAKAICLLEFVRDLPRTEGNIAAMLVDTVGDAAPVEEVKKALQALQAADFAILKDDGYELLTPTDKNWQKEKKGYLAPRPRDRNDILRRALEEICSEPEVRTFPYKGTRRFKVGVKLDSVALTDEGQIPLSLRLVDAPDDLPGRVAEVQNESRQDGSKNEIFWAFAMTPELDELVKNLHASRTMVNKYEQARAQTQITNEEMACLNNEKHEEARLSRSLHDKLNLALKSGAGLFRGVKRDASSLGGSLPEMFRKQFELAMPDLYPKLDMGLRSLSGKETEQFLTAANLNGLPQLFYSGDQGLNLVINDNGRQVPNPAADVAAEVLGYLNREHQYGNKDTRLGKALENHFSGLGYGWESDMIRLVLAVLFRASQIDVTYSGKRYDSYAEPQSRVPFLNVPAFRSSLFTPTKPLDRKVLTKAVECYESLTGKTVDVDKNAIATALKKFADAENGTLLQLAATAKAQQLPVVGLLDAYGETLRQIREGAAEDCVRLLAGEGATLKTTRDRVKELAKALSEDNLKLLHAARRAVHEMWPLLVARSADGDLKSIRDDLAARLEAESFFEAFAELRKGTDALVAAYISLYTGRHDERTRKYASAIEQVKGRPEWTSVPPDLQPGLLQPLTRCACERTGLEGMTCPGCMASLNEIEADLDALPSRLAGVAARIVEISTPKEKVQRVRIAGFFDGALDSEEAIRQAVEELREHLMKLHAEGFKIVVE